MNLRESLMASIEDRLTTAKSTYTATRGMSDLTRREFVKRGSRVLTGAAMAGPLLEFTARHSFAGERDIKSPYGTISPKKDQSTGLPLISLPDGFEYWSLGWTGDFLDSASGEPSRATPPIHDGMGVVDQFGSHVVLVRNHEVTDAAKSFASAAKTYSPVGGGGTTTLIWNTETHTLESHFASLGGTVRNCAGGVTPWKTWVSCEETCVTGKQGHRHGFAFEVSPTTGGSTPIPEMGRFSHEAIAVDHDGCVYLTEDSSMAGFYRFKPAVLGNLAAGGRLQMLTVSGRKNRKFNFDRQFAVPSSWDVEWTDVPAPAELGTFRRTFARGGARFTRLEGCWASEDRRQIFFVSTDGGVASKGQVFQFDVEHQRLTIIFDSPSERVAEFPDNFAVTPRAGMLFCEDHPPESQMPQRLLGMTPTGQAFTFAENRYEKKKGGDK